MNIEHDFAALSSKEWLETNGVGGWASSTLSGANTRRYHGLLVAALAPPTERRVLLSRLDETLITQEGTFDLATRNYPDINIPEGFRLLRTFRRSPFPTFEYGNGEFQLQKTICAIHGQNTTVVLYELLEAKQDIALDLRPFLAGRDYHWLEHARPTYYSDIGFQNGRLQINSFPGCVPFFIDAPTSEYLPGADWYYQFDFPAERERGLDCREDLYNPGALRIRLQPGDRRAVTISSELSLSIDGWELYDRERKRRAALLKKLPVRDQLCEDLTLAADQFIVRRGESGRTIIAGYHWFTDWGRDTMISLPGLCLATHRFSDAKAIIQQFAAHVSEGMLPNRFPDQGETPEYNTIDATLWFFVAVYKYFQYTEDSKLIKAILPTLEEIIAWHVKGTRYDIHVEENGLLAGGVEGTQLTWMDVKIGDWVVTPRHGKTVENNALWYNALRIVASLKEVVGSKDDYSKLRARAEAVRIEFIRQFWNQETGCLFDYLQAENNNSQVRPNQIFALSLPFPLLEADHAEHVLQTIERELLTPFGLRTLAASDGAFRPRYEGDGPTRDSAYHQGTVWPWLLGPYFTALVRYRGEKGRAFAKQILDQFLPHLNEAGLGTISEIFDGATPHQPRGCIAQAWSVAELLRSYLEDICGKAPNMEKTK